jgi:multidrug efflux pump subunit AcrA (membrane-fusion protein)
LRGLRQGLAFVVGAKHTWAKVAAVAVAGFLAFATLVNGEFRVEAPFTITATETQMVSVPFDGKLKDVFVEPGDMVFTESTGAAFDDLNAVNPLAPMMGVTRPATVLATMDTDKLQADRREKAAAVITHQQEAQVLRSKQDISGAQRAEDQAAEAQAGVDLIDKEMEEATIKAPMDGVVFQGDLKSKKNAPIQHGDQLFEIGNADLRAELNVSEDQIMDVELGQKGTLRATSYPDRSINFVVERITPIATVVTAKNVFKVRVILTSADTKWLKPGVEGLGKIDVVQAKYGWIWTHKMVNWVRMKLWI